jgi:eukaryotic-like serine/threonine-protein kinase
MSPSDEKEVQPQTGSNADDLLISLQPEERAPSAGRGTRAISGLLPGDLLANRFRILRYIARGGMGEVYEAEDLELNVHIALKTVLLSESAGPDALTQLKQEVQTARQVTHPNVCRIFDIAQHRDPQAPDAGIWFITMELLEARSLSQEIAQKGKLTPEAARQILKQLAAGLDAIHDAGIIHGDFKSANVLLVDLPNGKVRPVITDFGLAVQGAAADKASGAGTALYMAPEQVERRELTPRTDIYALGVVLFEMVTGNWPFLASTAEGTARKRLTEKPISPARFSPELDAIWTRVILRCLALDPADRFARASEIAHELRKRSFYELRWLQASAAVALLCGSGLITARLLQWGPFHVPSAVAVVGWRNISRNPQDEAIGTELSERLTDLLAQNKTLSVIPQQEVATGRRENEINTNADFSEEDLGALRTAFNGSFLVSGEYAIQAGMVQVRGELQDASGRVRQRFEESGSEQNIGDLAARVDADLTPALRLPMTSASELAQLRQIYPGNADARSLYFRALDDLRAFRAADARDRLLHATAIEPTSVAIHEALAESWALLRLDPQARVEAARAAALAKNQDLLPEYVTATEARQAELDGRWSDAADQYEQLNHFYPTRPEYLTHYTQALIEAGKANVALARLDQLKPREREPIGEASLDLARARAYGALGDFSRELDSANRSVAEASKSGERLRVALAQKEICWANRNLDRPDAALAACSVAQSTFTAFNDFVNAEVVLNSIAVMRTDRGEYPAALEALLEVVSVVRKAGSQVDLAGALLNLADAQIQMGDTGSAESNLRQSLDISGKIQDQSDEVAARIALASVLDSTNRTSDAVQELHRALDGAKQLGNRDLQATALSNLADDAIDAGDLSGAESMLREALSLRNALGEESGVAKLEQSLGDIARRRGHTDEAKQDYSAAMATFEHLNQRANLAATWLQLGDLDLDRRDYAAALARARAASAEYEKEKAHDAMAEAIVLEARAQVGMADWLAARQSLAQARNLSVTDPETLEEIEIVDAVAQGANGSMDQAGRTLQRIESQAAAAGRTENVLEAKLASLQLRSLTGDRSAEATRATNAFIAEARHAEYANLAADATDFSRKQVLKR